MEILRETVAGGSYWAGIGAVELLVATEGDGAAFETAALLAGLADLLRTETGVPRQAEEERWYESVLERLELAVGVVRFQELRVRGSALTLPQALSLVSAEAVAWYQKSP